jgi:hypothetical protein
MPSHHQFDAYARLLWSAVDYIAHCYRTRLVSITLHFADGRAATLTMPDVMPSRPEPPLGSTPETPPEGGRKSGGSPAEDSPPAAGGDVLSECELDCLEMIALAGKRLKGDEVRIALRRAGKVHGESTVVKALAKLTGQRKELTNRTDAYGSGYGLAEWK